MKQKKPEPIALDDATTMPRELRILLDSLRHEFQQHTYVDSFARSAEARSVMAKMAEFLNQRHVIGVHYTRAERRDIESGGLLCGPGANRRAWFLERYGHHFLASEIKTIRSEWRRRYDAHENSIRDHRVFFNLTPKALTDGRAKPLLELFGGETIYMGLLGQPDILAKIRTLGAPLVVRCRLSPPALTGFWEHPAALVWLSAYHVAKNPQAQPYDVDVCATTAIPPEDILSIETPDHWQ